MTLGKATGGQITFFIFATWLLAVPLTRIVAHSLQAGPELGSWLERGFHILIVGAGFLAIRPLRRLCIDALRVPVAPGGQAEIGFAVTLSMLATFGFVGSYALWWFAVDGPLGLEQRIAAMGTHAKVTADSLQPVSIATQGAMAVLLVPLVEELLFRRFLYRAWAERHGWVVAALLSSAIFALLHNFFFGAFLASLVFTCVYRRTGSLRAAILVHGAHNLLVYYPLLGQFIVPLSLEFPGDLASWWMHLVALAATGVALPWYMWSARDRSESSQAVELDHVALPR